MHNQIPNNQQNHHLGLHYHIISCLSQDDTSSYSECHFLFLNPNNSLYLSPDGNLGFFKCVLVKKPSLLDQSPDQSTHCKYLLCCRLNIYIPHLSFIQFVQFVAVGGPLLPNQHKGK